MTLLPPASWLGIANRTAIITGAASGIGASIAKSLVAQGCHIVLADVDSSSLTEVTNYCRGTSSSAATSKLSDDNVIVRPVVCNVTCSTDVKDLIRVGDDVATAVAGGGPLVASILVNCAGVTKDGFISKMDEDDFDQVINVNLRGTFLTCKHFCTPSRLEILSSSKSTTTTGTIINIGSVVGSYGNLGQTNYAASKGGVTSLTKSLAKEMGRYGVRANVVLPGFINTPMTQKVPDKVLNKMREGIVLGRLGEVEDVSDLVLFLTSDRSKFITGESIECSGMASL